MGNLNCWAIAWTTATTLALAGAKPALFGNKGYDCTSWWCRRAWPAAHSAWSLKACHGHRASGSVEQVHPSERFVPAPSKSVLVAGSNSCASFSVMLVHEMVRLAASTSLSIHQVATTANLRGWHGPSWV